MALFYPITALGFVIYLFLVLLLSRLLGLTAGSLLFFNISLSLIGLAAATITTLLCRKRQLRRQASAKTGPSLDADITFLVREANKTLNAKQRRKLGRKVSKLPVVLFLGDSGTTKTSLIENSGLEPELLAGHVFEDDHIVPTPLMNLWLVNNT